MKTRISKQVSVSEMMTLREQGLTNKQIADRLDIGYSTVCAYIGRAPAGLRKPYERKNKPLPPVGDNPIPDMPHESFKERCERLYSRAEEYNKAVNDEVEKLKETAPAEPAGAPAIPAREAAPASEADKEREAHSKLIEENHSTPYTTDKEASSPIPELIAVFGPDAVTVWLKVSLYNMGIPDCRPMNRQKMLEMLKIMNAGGADT